MDTQVAVVLALSFGALTVETVNVVLRRRARPAVSSCDRLHRIAVMERDIYGEVLSPDAAEHVAKCGKRPTPPTGPGAASRPLRWGSAGDFERAAGAQRRSMYASQMAEFRAIVAECEEIKRVIEELTHRDRVRADLGVDGYAPDPRLAELRAALTARLSQLDAMTRAWDTLPRHGPATTRTC